MKKVFLWLVVGVGVLSAAALAGGFFLRRREKMLRELYAEYEE